MLTIDGLCIKVGEKEILRGISLDIEPGKIYALMGPNGSGKSTLANALVGHPKYKVTAGKIHFQGEDITAMSPDLRAQRGIFLSFQYPKSIPGVTMANFLRSAYKAVKKEEIRVFDFQKKLKEKMVLLKMPSDFTERFVNEGFSGGEKKKAEILQAMLLEPQLIVMDETDSGLDVDALKIVADGVKKLMNSKTSVLLITHYTRILKYLKPNVVHILKGGELVATGGAELARTIEDSGFDEYSSAKKTVKKVKSAKKKTNVLQILD